MISRRRFIKQAGAYASAAFILTQPRRYKLGLQLYTVRAAMRQDVDGALARIAGIGYEELETYGFDPNGIRYYGLDARRSTEQAGPCNARRAADPDDRARSFLQARRLGQKRSCSADAQNTTLQSQEEFSAFSRKSFGIIKIRTDGNRMLVYTYSGKDDMKEAYAFRLQGERVIPEPVRKC